MFLIESVQHCFRYWFVAYSAPSHYLNQCWVIVNWTLRNKLQLNIDQNTKLFIHKNASENIVCEKAAISDFQFRLDQFIGSCEYWMTFWTKLPVYGEVWFWTSDFEANLRCLVAEISLSKIAFRSTSLDLTDAKSTLVQILIQTLIRWLLLFTSIKLSWFHNLSSRNCC